MVDYDTITSSRRGVILKNLGSKRLDKTKMVQYTYLDELSEAYDYILTKEMYENQKIN